MIFFRSKKFSALDFVSVCTLQLPLAIKSIGIYINMLIKMAEEDKN